MNHSNINNITFAKNFIFAGNSLFTIVSKKTKKRFTFKVKKSKTKEAYWIHLLRGPDNTSDYRYIGAFYEDGFKAKIDRPKTGLNINPIFQPGAKTPTIADSTKAIAWFLANLQNNNLPTTVELWHYGKCGACGRRLTVPESIQSGLGPECRSKI